MLQTNTLLNTFQPVNNNFKIVKFNISSLRILKEEICLFNVDLLDFTFNEHFFFTALSQNTLCTK